MTNIVDQAYNDFMISLFGEVPANPREKSVDYYEYVQRMEEIQKKYGLYQGHPLFLEFMLTMVGKSPYVKGAEEDATNNTR